MTATVLEPIVPSPLQHSALAWRLPTTPSLLFEQGEFAIGQIVYQLQLGWKAGLSVGQSLPPQLLEPRRVSGGVANGVLNVAVPEIVLNEAGVCALVGEGKSAGMAQHVGMNGHRELGLLTVFAQGQVDGRAVQGLALLTEKERPSSGLIESPSQVSSPRLRPLGLVGGNGSLLCQNPLLSMALPT